MIFLALISWAVSLSCLIASSALFYRRRSSAGLAMMAVLLVQIHVRPLIFFLGLDRPAPHALFDADSWHLVASGLLLSAFWICAVTAAYVAFIRVAPGNLMPQAPADCSHGLVKICTTGVTAISVTGTLLLVLQSGSVAAFVYDVKISKELAGSYVIREIGTLASIIGCFGMFLRAGGADRHARSRGGHGTAYLYVALILLNFFTNYLWGNRYNIAVLCLAFGMGWHFYVRRFKAHELILGGLLVLFILDGLRQLRWVLFAAATGQEELGSGLSFWSALSASLHFNQFDAFLLAIRDAGERFDFRDGRDLVNGLLSWVPRFVYPEKETFHVGGWFRQVYQPDVINGWPITVIGNWYVNLGALGVLLGGLLSGFVAAMIDRAYRPSASAWAATAGPSVAFTLLDGGVDFGFVQRAVLVLVPLYLFTLLLRSAGPRNLGRRSFAALQKE